MRSIGLMSGTSGDGVDAIMLELDDPRTPHHPQVLGHAYVPFDDALRSELANPAALTVERVAQLHFLLPQLCARAIRQLPEWKTAEVVGMHGQTLWHAPPSARPEIPCTLQVGSASALATVLDRPVVGDLRTADVVLGGEGAPIIPFAHWFFCSQQRADLVVVNVGGIANYTLVRSRLEDVEASDIGPGTMITDALARHVSSGRASFDRDGVWSAGGRSQASVVDYVLEHPFFQRPAPRSTGREDFGQHYTAQLVDRFGRLRHEDLLASSVDATAAAIVRACACEAPSASTVLLTGGGALHPRLRTFVEARNPSLEVQVAHEGVMAPQHHEPAGMALIAARTLKGLPSSVPHVTGASRPAILGHICLPAGSSHLHSMCQGLTRS